MLKITQFVCYIVHMICVYKIQATQNNIFSVYINSKLYSAENETLANQTSRTKKPHARLTHNPRKNAHYKRLAIPPWWTNWKLPPKTASPPKKESSDSTVRLRRNEINFPATRDVGSHPPLPP